MNVELPRQFLEQVIYFRDLHTRFECTKNRLYKTMHSECLTYYILHPSLIIILRHFIPSHAPFTQSLLVINSYYHTLRPSSFPYISYHNTLFPTITFHPLHITLLPLTFNGVSWVVGSWLHSYTPLCSNNRLRHSLCMVLYKRFLGYTLPLKLTFTR